MGPGCGSRSPHRPHLDGGKEQKAEVPSTRSALEGPLPSETRRLAGPTKELVVFRI